MTQRVNDNAFDERKNEKGILTKSQKANNALST